jgi:hypothetical protein
MKKNVKRWVVIGLVLLGLVLVFAWVGNAVASHIVPKQVYFPFLARLENFQLQLTRNPEQKISRQLYFAERWLDSMLQVSGTENELIAAENLTATIAQASENIQALEPDQRDPYRAQVDMLHDKVHETLAQKPTLPRWSPLAYYALHKTFEELVALLHPDVLSGDQPPVAAAEAVVEDISSSTPKSRYASSIQDDIIPLVTFRAQNDPHPYDGQCFTCHFFEGDCARCHHKSLPAAHYDRECTLCHTYEDWHTTSIDHLGSGLYDCATCHQEQKPADHYAGECSTCHKVSGWQPANLAHIIADEYPCLMCHAEDRPEGHYDLPCRTCHTPMGWLPVVVDHSDPAFSDCTACHTDAAPANHYTMLCSLCHTPTVWSAVTFNHTGCRRGGLPFLPCECCTGGSLCGPVFGLSFQPRLAPGEF